MSVSSWTRGKIAVLGAPLLVLALGIAFGGASRFGAGSEPVGAANSGTSGLSGPSIASFADGGTHVYALLWSGTDRLWYVGSSGDDVARLYRYDVSTRRTLQWQLPFPTPQTPFTFLSEDGEGLIWVAANYTLAALIRYLAASPTQANWILRLKAPSRRPSTGLILSPEPGSTASQ